MAIVNRKKTYAIIRAIYNHSHSPEDFERELDFVLSRKVCMVIIEPESLGEITWRWIRTGNWLHKTAVISGIAAVTTAGIGLMWNSTFSKICFPLDLGIRWFHTVRTDGALITITPSIIRFTTTALSAVSASAAGLYALFWQWDPCCKYQVASSLASLPVGTTSFVTNDNSPGSGMSNGGSPSGSSEISQAGNGKRPRAIIAENHSSSSSPPLRPVVLVHRDDGRRKMLHNTISLTSTLVACYILFRWSRYSNIIVGNS
ncbi:Transmembrane protein 11 mitochondrial [Schistosoma japonicum]|nr:Transmembrane protein 11 mitochondrial [Schistosoma japonicum]